MRLRRFARTKIELLGYGKIQLGATIDWNRDPYTGRRWELRFWSDYNPEFDNDGRDSKVIHELNRQQHLPRLAKAWYLTGHERYAKEAVAQMIGWIDQNPVGRSINWQSSLEIGIRSMSWIWTLFLLFAHGRLMKRGPNESAILFLLNWSTSTGTTPASAALTPT